MFIRIGSGLNTSYIPVDQLANNLGEMSCLNILKAHIATGCDWLIKLGCKSKALDKMNLLIKFGEGNLTEELLDKAEEYLCSLVKGKEVFKTFSDYRHHQLTKHAFFVYYENADVVYDVIRMRQLSKQTLHELSSNDNS